MNPINYRKFAYDNQRHPSWEKAVNGYHQNIAVAKEALKLMYEGGKMGYSMVQHKFGPNYDNFILSKAPNSRKAQEIAIIDDYMRNHVLKEFGQGFAEPGHHKIGPEAQNGICQHMLHKACKNSKRVNTLDPPGLIKFLDKMSQSPQPGQYRYAKEQVKSESTDIKKRFKTKMANEICALEALNEDFAHGCRGSLNGEQMKAECEAAFDQFETINPFMTRIKAFSVEMSSEKAEDFIRIIMQDPDEAIQTLTALQQNGLINVQLRSFFDHCADLLRQNLAIRNRWLNSFIMCEQELKELRERHKQVRPTAKLQPLTEGLINSFLHAAGRPPLPNAVPAHPPLVVPGQGGPNQPPVVDHQVSPAQQHPLPPAPPVNLKSENSAVIRHIIGKIREKLRDKKTDDIDELLADLEKQLGLSS